MKDLKSLGRSKVAILAVVSSVILGLGSCNKASSKQMKIGILQLADHQALNLVHEGFVEALAEDGFEDGKNIKIDYELANNEQSNMISIAQQFKGQNALNFAIATPAAQALLNVDSETPLVFSPITDPVGAKLASDWEKPGKNATGTSDAIPMDKLLEHLKLLAPDAKKIGMIYNAGQANSVVQWQEFEAECNKQGLEAIPQTISSTNDVKSATLAIVKKADALVLPTDNDVASAIPIIADVVKQEKLPAIGSDVAHIEACLATFGVDYKEIGKQTGHMAAVILKGEKKASDMPIEKAEKFSFDLNAEMFAAFGMDPTSIPTDE